MNKNFILLIFIAFIAGCVGVNSEVNSSEILNNSVENVNNSDLKKVENIADEIEKKETLSEEIIEKVKEKPQIVKEDSTNEELVSEVLEIKEEIKKKEIVETKKSSSKKSEETKVNVEIYKYPFEVDGKTINMQFYNNLDDIEKLNYKIGISKEEFFETETFDFIFNSKPSSNGAVVKVSGRLYTLMSIGFGFPLNALEDIISSDEITCADSTLSNKLILFDSDYTSNEVLYDSETGCIEFKTTSQELMGSLGDKFLLHILN